MLGEDGQGCQRAPACVIKDTLTPCLPNWCQTAASQLGWEMTARRHHLSPHGSLDSEVPSCVPSDGVRNKFISAFRMTMLLDLRYIILPPSIGSKKIYDSGFVLALRMHYLHVSVG